MVRRSILPFAALLLTLVAAGGCKRLNTAYCDNASPCASGKKCDVVARECVDATADLGPDAGVEDLAAEPDFAGVDLAGADFARADLAVADMVPVMDLVGADLSGCGGTVCNPGGAGNAFCKNACMTTTAKCGVNGLCNP